MLQSANEGNQVLTIRTWLCSGLVLLGLLFVGFLPNQQSSAITLPAPALHLAGAGELVDVAELNSVELGRSKLTAGPTATQRQLTLRAMGSCDDIGGLWFYGRGFTPGGEFLVGANYPGDSIYQGALYGRITRDGRANKDGSITALRLECVDFDTKVRDPLGIYTIVLNDLSTGERIRVSFVMR